MGRAKSPQPQPVTPPPDPDANEKAKSVAAETKTREQRRAAYGSMNKTIATSGEGVLGAAPVNKPELKSSLG